VFDGVENYSWNPSFGFYYPINQSLKAAVIMAEIKIPSNMEGRGLIFSACFSAPYLSL
jgi:hypothetical protein